jgi:hypothetical protein
MPSSLAIPAGFLVLLAAFPTAAADSPAAPADGSAVEPSPEQRPGPVAVVVELEGYPTDPTLVQLAVAKELGVAVTDATVGSSATVRIVAKKGGDLTVVVERPDKPRLMRAVAAPGRDDEVPEAAALLAGNLARDEAADLLLELTPEPEPEARAPTPEPSPEPEPKRAAKTTMPNYALNLSLFHPVTIVPDAERTRFAVEFGLFYSRVGAVDAFSLNPFVLAVHGPARGAEIAGIVSVNEDGLEGMRVSGVYASHRGRFHGFAASGVATTASGAGEGGVVSGVATIQNGPFRGFRAAGVVDVQSGPFVGMQSAGLVNLADDVEGLQVSGTNVASDVSGAQIGIVNVGGNVSGLQLGVINVADDVDGASIGVVTLSDEGRVQPVAWYSNATPMNLGLRLYTGPLYAMPTLGFAQGTDDDGNTVAVFHPGLSLGARVSIARAFVDLDVNYSNRAPEFRYDEHEIDLRYRALVGFEVTPWLAPFVGGGVRQYIRSAGDKRESYHPELSAGVQFF